MSSICSSTRVIGRRLLRRKIFPQLSNGGLNNIRCSSNVPPDKLIAGLTQEQVDSDPNIQAFIEANFSEESEVQTDGYSIPAEILKEYGLDESDFAPLDIKQYGDPRVDFGMGTTEEQQARNIRLLSTYTRTEEGTLACDRLRENKIIPGIIYGSDAKNGVLSINKDTRIMVKTPWSVLQRELDRFHRTFESRVYDLTLYEDPNDTEGTLHRVIPRDVQRHPVKGTIYCANFLRYHPGRPLKLPIVYINQEESPALKRDGFIIPVNKYIECLIEDGAPIPDALELECTGLKLKDVVRIDRINFPDGVRPSKRVNLDTFIVGPVAGGRGGEMDGEGEGEEKAE